MPRAGQQAREDEGGLEDRISVGVLARAFPRELVDEVIDAAGARERRRRVLPAWLTLYFMLALALFMDRGALRVMRKLAGVLAWAEHGVMVSMPSEEALSNARARLGAEPLRLLFGKVAGPVAPPGAAGAWWRGLRLVSLDGTTLDAQDEQANWQRFGGPSTKNAEGKRLRGAFPQVRLVALAECGTRALIGAVPGAFSTGEKTLARELIGKLGGGMLCLADRNFACWELWRDAAATGAALLWRIGASFSLPVDEVLGDGRLRNRAAVQDPRRRGPGGLGAAVCLPRRPRADQRRRRAGGRRPAADLLHQRPGRHLRPGRHPGLFFPLTGLTGSAGPRWPSSPPSPPGPGQAGPTRARPSAAPGTRPSQPTRRSDPNAGRHH